MSFDPTINIGSLLTLGAMVVGIIIYITSGKSDTKVLTVQLVAIDAQMEDFKIEMKKLTEIIIEQTRQDGRIANVETRQLMEGERIDAMENTFRQLLIDKSNSQRRES